MTIPEYPSLVNQFLLAMPSLHSSIFTSSLTFLFEHSEEGAAGLVINKAIDMSVEDVFMQLEMPVDGAKAGDQVLIGGPVSPQQGFVVHRKGEWKETLSVSADLQISTSLDILHSLANDEGPDEAIVILGYAGWGPGQLEEELSSNAWLTLDVDPDIIFDTPLAERTDKAAQRLGFDLSKLGICAGHA
ncbi:MAG: YqgE/AlgH family protein [Pseudomonadales bacterium]